MIIFQQMNRLLRREWNSIHLLWSTFSIFYRNGEIQRQNNENRIMNQSGCWNISLYIIRNNTLFSLSWRRKNPSLNTIFHRLYVWNDGNILHLHSIMIRFFEGGKGILLYFWSMQKYWEVSRSNGIYQD